MIQFNGIKEKLKSGKPVIGTFLRFTDPAVVEIAALAGMEFFILDNEHVIYNDQTVLNMFIAGKASGIIPFIRVTNHSKAHIDRFLDSGAMGIVVPLVDTYEQAKKICDAVKYPPLGLRGFSNIQRGAHYGMYPDMDNYSDYCNANTMVVSYCESKEAVENIEEIVKIPEIDVVFIGPYDLSQSLGVTGKINDPIVQNAIEKVIKASLKAGKAVGSVAGSVEAAQNWIERGVRFIAISSDYKMVGDMSKNMIKELKSLNNFL